MSGIIEKAELTLSNEQSKAFWYLVSPKYADIARVVYGGAAYGGKSTLISAWLDYMCNTFEGTRYYLGRETLKDIKESVLLTFFDFIKQSGSQIKYNEQKSKITYHNGSEIYLLETFNYPADPNFDRFGSREYTGGAIEEGVTTVKRAADILLSRTRYKHQDFNLYPKQLITLNPGDGWIKEDIVIPTLDGTGPKRKSDVFVMATLESNPNKSAALAYKKNLEENLSSYDRERLLNGNWNAKPKHGAEFLKDFNPDNHTGAYEYDHTLPLHISFDENVNPHITCLIFQIKIIGQLKIVRQIGEICNKPPVNTRKHVCNEIIKRYKGHITGMFIYGDATSRKNTTDREAGENFFTDIISYLKEFNPSLRVPSINPPVVGKGGFLNLVFEKDYRGIEFRIDKSCKVSINDYAYAVEDAEGGISKKKVTDPDTGISYEKWGHCFIAGTRITTDHGQVPIESIKVGDKVLTRNGFKKVYASALTRKNAEVFTYDLGKHTITCTSDHKIWTDNGFKESKLLMQSDILFIFDEWKGTLSFTTASNLQDTLTQKVDRKKNTILDSLMGKRKGFTFIFGRQSTKKKFLTNFIFTIKTKILLTIILIIWNVSLGSFTCRSMVKRMGLGKLKRVLKILIELGRLQNYGMHQNRVLNGIESTQKTVLERSHQKYTHANNAVRYSQINTLNQNSVPEDAHQQAEENLELIMKKESAFVAESSPVINTQNKNIVPRNAAGFQDVYNISIEGCPEYFANGVLVHNCIDSMSYFICEVFLSDFNYYLNGGNSPVYEVGNDRSFRFER